MVSRDLNFTVYGSTEGWDLRGPPAERWKALRERQVIPDCLYHKKRGAASSRHSGQQRRFQFGQEGTLRNTQETRVVMQASAGTRGASLNKAHR